MSLPLTKMEPLFSKLNHSLRAFMARSVTWMRLSTPVLSILEERIVKVVDIVTDQFMFKESNVTLLGQEGLILVQRKISYIDIRKNLFDIPVITCVCGGGGEYLLAILTASPQMS